MEIHFQQQQQKNTIPMGKVSKLIKGRNRSNLQNNKYVGVRQRPSGRWVAEIKDTTKKIRMWLGTFETAEEAAHAYDEAACLLRGSNTRTNFVTHHVSPDSPLALRVKNLLNKRKLGSKLQHTNDSDPTPGNFISSSTTNASSPTTSSSSGGGGDSSRISFDSAISFDQKAEEDGHPFHDAYKPDLSNLCAKEFERGLASSSAQSDMSSWGFQVQEGFDSQYDLISTGHDDHQSLELPKNNSGSLSETTHHLQFSEFERMKVERQISASLYAMNGVQEYMDTVCDPIEALWDLPPLCSLLC